MIVHTKSAYQECIPRDEGPQGDVSSKGSFQASFTLALFIFVVGIFRHAITKGLATKWHNQRGCCQATTSFPCSPSLPLWVHKLFILPLPIILHILFTPPSSNHWDNMQFSWIKFPQSHSLLARFWFPSTHWWALQALYAQNSWILPIHHTISSKRYHYNPHTLDNTTDFRSIGQKHSDTVLKPWHPLLMHSVILPSSPRITITISHHGKAPLIDNHPKTGLLHHSEASGWCCHQSFNEMTWLMRVPSQLRQLQLWQL